ncbi:hypothetical protein B0H14DRAFT_2644048 [Mycena olivaceomarginata]|nr:hypothetical protein B0H14DRAFT_2644048 [Mycena olivaceomarginata]
MTAHATYCEKAAEASERYHDRKDARKRAAASLTRHERCRKQEADLRPTHLAQDPRHADPAQTAKGQRPIAATSLYENKDEKDNEGEIDTFPEAFENIVRIAHDWLVLKAAALSRQLMAVDGSARGLNI